MTNVINFNDFKKNQLEARINTCFNKIKLALTESNDYGFPLLSILMNNVEKDFLELSCYEQDEIIMNILDKLE